MNETSQFFTRDLSWLSFNHRVLQEAKDKSVPLYERIKFLAIYSSNLDEFFRVRVASLRSFKQLKKNTRRELGVKPKKELREIRKIVGEQQTEFGRIFREEILPELESHQIFLIDDQQFDKHQQAFAKQFFLDNLSDHIEVHTLDEGANSAPFLKNKALYFVVQTAEDNNILLINIPSEKSARFVELPGTDGHYLTFIDDIIRFNLSEIIKKPIKAAYAVKISRDAEIYIDDEYSGDLLEKLKKGLDDRNVGLPTRFLYDSTMPDDLLAQLKTWFDLTKYDLIPGAGHHNFNDFFGFPDPTNNQQLHNVPMPPLPHPELENATSLLEKIDEKDILLHFPYQRYDYIPQLIREAADDPDVKSVKITLYRVASRSAVVEALLYALEKGKSVMAFIEAKARFDEESNLYWGGELEKAGGRIYYSYPGIKVHTKLLLITRKEADKKKYYAYLGTGNFNEKTARLYCDHALLTSKQKMGAEVNQVFDILERKLIVPKCKHLMIAPFHLGEGFMKMIDQEIANARAGKDAYMILKMNSLEDPDIIQKLYEASQAGVRIRMIVRGICCLIPGVKGQSENIEITSIVDRFLEHARVYIFGNDGKEKIYTASADWMSRNLHRRIEVAIPIYDEDLHQELRHIINLQLADNTKARVINATQSNHYVSTPNGAKPYRSQMDIYAFLKKKVMGVML
ncbi:MAG: polyphosphate kinase [Saprospiraceae bacterium]|nr:MAG: polyphosphate kinase [Saprospiraceae bacterium]